VAPSTTAPPVPAPAAATTTVAVDLTDTSRPTVSHGVTVAPSRHLPTTVYLPSAAGGAPSGRNLPWLVFLHGFGVTPATYDQLLRSWAAAGFAVAAPTLPLTSGTGSAPADEADMVNEPADVTFLISSLLRLSAAPTGALSGRLDPSRIAVAGHSDGSDVAFTSGYSTRFRDPRVRAVVDLSGELPTGMGPFAPRAAGPPLLMVVSDSDEYVPFAHSQELYAARCCDKWWVELHGVAHLPPFAGQEPWATVARNVTIDFLHRELAGEAVPSGQLERDANVPQVSTLQASAP
jgi:predicted dienelactone hydrolase